MNRCPTESERVQFLEESGAGPPDARIEGHLEQCGTCRAWLEEARADEALLDVVRGAVDEPPLRPPVDIGHAHEELPLTDRALQRYRILRRIGAGGMGVVYEAEQRRPQRSVALKVLRPGLSSQRHLQRFEYEAEVLGRLDHPGIARVYEAGTFGRGDERRPFFAMELIRGRPLLEHLRQKRLPVRQRLHLFQQICEAVHHAHSNGVIHRDLKPANILVTDDGVPKVLDFGVARATNTEPDTTSHTGIGQILGTLSYMSPEQVGGDPADLDVRSDVYSLGVIFHEILTDRRPYDLDGLALAEAMRVIRDQRPRPLSSDQRVLRGDLETIGQKALEKQRARRYDSAHELGADVERFLRNEPIRARPPSSLYHWRKFAERNRALVGSVAAAFVVLLAGLIATSMLWRKASAAEDDAASEAFKARAVSDFLMKSLVLASPDQNPGREMTIAEVFQQAAARVEEDFQALPEVQAELHHTVGWTLMRMGALDEAEPHLVRALELWRAHSGTESLEVATGLSGVGEYERLRGRAARAETSLRQALELRERLGAAPRLLALNHDKLGCALLALQRPAEAAEVFRRGLPASESGVEEFAHDHGVYLNNFGYALHASGQHEEAVEQLLESHRLRREPAAAFAVSDRVAPLALCAQALTDLGRFREAARCLGDAADALLAESIDPASLTPALRHLATALERLESGRGAGSVTRFEQLALRASCHRLLGEPRRAGGALEIVLQESEVVPLDDELLEVLPIVVRELEENDRADQVEPLWCELLERTRRERPGSDLLLPRVQLGLGETLLSHGHLQEAELHLLDSHDVLHASGTHPHHAAHAAHLLADLYRQQGDSDEASRYRRLEDQHRQRAAVR